MAIGRFRELRAMTGEIDALGEQLEARKAIERAKGVLMDELKMSEQDAFTFIQRTAMSERSKMRQIADRVIAGTARPDDGPIASDSRRSACLASWGSARPHRSDLTSTRRAERGR